MLSSENFHFLYDPWKSRRHRRIGVAPPSLPRLPVRIMDRDQRRPERIMVIPGVRIMMTGSVPNSLPAAVILYSLSVWNTDEEAVMFDKLPLPSEGTPSGACTTYMVSDLLSCFEQAYEKAWIDSTKTVLVTVEPDQSLALVPHVRRSPKGSDGLESKGGALAGRVAHHPSTSFNHPTERIKPCRRSMDEIRH